MAAQHLDAAIAHLLGHHQQQSAAISAGSQTLDRLADLTSAAKTRATDAMVAEFTALSSGSCSTCAGLVTDGVAATKTPIPTVEE